MRVSEIMQTDLVTCAPTATVSGAARVMRDRRVGAVLVMDRGRLAGILTERDLVGLLADGGDPGLRAVSQVMTSDVVMAPPDADVLWAGDAMRRNGVRHLPVGEDGMVSGIVSLRDLFVLAEAVLRLDPAGADTARGVLAAAGG